MTGSIKDSFFVEKLFQGKGNILGLSCIKATYAIEVEIIVFLLFYLITFVYIIAILHFVFCIRS